MAGDLNRSEHLNRSEGAPRKLRSTLGVRLAGAALCTAGLAFIGFGTLGAPATKGLSLTSAPTCATGTECIKPSQVPTAVANATCTSQDIPGNSAPDNTDSWWHFVVPSSQNWVFTGSGFTATVTGGSIENVSFVQPTTGGFKGVVVEADGGATLTNAFVADSGTNEPSEQEGTGAEGDDFVLSSSCGGDVTTSTTASVSTTKTVTAPGTTVTTTVSGPTTTTTAPGTTNTTTKTVSTATTLTSPTTTTAPGTTNTTTKTVSTVTTVTSPTTVTNNSTATNTVTTTVNTTVTKTTTAPGTTVTTTVTVPTTATATTTVTSNHTATTTVTAPTTVTAGTTVTTSAIATTTKTVTTGSAGSPTSSTSSSSSSSRTPTSGVAAATTTPSTGSGSDIAFGTGLVLLVAGGGLIAGATRITRRKKN